MRSVSYQRLPCAREVWVGLFIGLVLLSPAHLEAGTDPKGTPARVDAPFTTSVETPHVPWGKPSPGPPIRAFVVPSVSEGRTLIELAERMNLTFDTVMIDEAWDVNTWTVGTDDNYEARNYKLLYGYLTDDLTSSKPYEVIVLPSLHGWNRLSGAARDAICRRVREGAGLVLIHPTTGLPAPDDPKVKGPLNDFIDAYDVPPSTPKAICGHSPPWSAFSPIDWMHAASVRSGLIRSPPGHGKSSPTTTSPGTCRLTLFRRTT